MRARRTRAEHPGPPQPKTDRWCWVVHTPPSRTRRRPACDDNPHRRTITALRLLTCGIGAWRAHMPAAGAAHTHTHTHGLRQETCMQGGKHCRHQGGANMRRPIRPASAVVGKNKGPAGRCNWGCCASITARHWVQQAGVHHQHKRSQHHGRRQRVPQSLAAAC